MLTHYGPHLPIIIVADASEHGTKAVLNYKFTDGSRNSVSDANRIIINATKQYSRSGVEQKSVTTPIHLFGLLYRPLGVLNDACKFQRFAEGIK